MEVDDTPGPEDSEFRGERRSRERRRARPGSGPRARKERVLHTRISDQLAEDIRRMADDLRVPVSNLVRNVLEETFSVVEAVSDNVGDFVDEVIEEAEQARERIRRRRPAPQSEAAPSERRAYPDVIGWQPLIFNQARSCSDCAGPIGVGERGFAGLTASGLSPAALCGDCMEARRS